MCANFTQLRSNLIERKIKHWLMEIFAYKCDSGTHYPHYPIYRCVLMFCKSKIIIIMTEQFIYFFNFKFIIMIKFTVTWEAKNKKWHNFKNLFGNKENFVMRFTV